MRLFELRVRFFEGYLRRQENRLNQFAKQAEIWKDRAIKAIRLGEDDLAKESISRHLEYNTSANAMRKLVDMAADIHKDMRAALASRDIKVSLLIRLSDELVIKSVVLAEAEITEDDNLAAYTKAQIEELKRKSAKAYSKIESSEQKIISQLLTLDPEQYFEEFTKNFNKAQASNTDTLSIEEVLEALQKEIDSLY